MNKQNLTRRARNIVYVAGINLAVFAALFLVFELAVHLIWPEGNPWLGPPFARSKFRVASPIYGHTLAPNYTGDDEWGTTRATIATLPRASTR